MGITPTPWAQVSNKAGWTTNRHSVDTESSLCPAPHPVQGSFCPSGISYGGPGSNLGSASWQKLDTL